MKQAGRNTKAWLAVLALAASLWPAASRADVWGYIDARGVAHFAERQVDERYTLFYKGDESFDTRSGAGAFNPPAEERPALPPKLQNFFDVSPTYKLVKPHLREAARKHGIEVELLQALIVAESGFDRTAVSPKGAVGLMQIMPATAERYGLTGDAKTPIEAKLADPKTNIGIGTRYLRFLLDLFPGQLDLALASYNAGEGAVMKAGNRIPNYKETQEYVRTVMRLYRGLKPPVEARRQSPLRVRMELRGRPPQAAADAATTVVATQLAQQP
ncbi:lytic transglycosylase domain-containing protein [Pseudorhodoferax sp.]|uniref:lytic transglycosylase domain-containing protein n=1 Tax=Pseudorhodoferax sp. TaxID=1993553 RepID=UPI0039E61085